MAETSPGNSGKIEKKVLIKASPAVVYRALTDARDLVSWFCDRATSDPRPGGELTAYWKAGKTARKGRAVYTRILPDCGLELLWEDDCEALKGTQHRLSYTIRPRREGSEVVMQDDGDLPDEETFTFLDQGWNGVLLELKDFCERKERLGKPHKAGVP